MKKCISCGLDLEQSNFHNKKSKCKSCQAEYDRNRRVEKWVEICEKDHNRYMRYRTDLDAFIRRTYKNMLNRVKGHGLINNAYYKGLPICTREEWIEFCSKDANLPILFKTWQEAGWPKELVPSPDRLIPECGYVIGNVEICTFRENIQRQHKDNNSPKIFLHGISQTEDKEEVLDL